MEEFMILYNWKSVRKIRKTSDGKKLEAVGEIYRNDNGTMIHLRTVWEEFEEVI